MLKTLLKKISFIPIFLLFSGIMSFTPAHAAASFSVSGGRTLTAGQSLTVTISVYRSTTYNAVSLNVSSSNITITGASVTGGWTAVSGPSRTANSASFSGALLGQNITGSKAVLVLTLRAPSTPGNASLSISGQISGSGSGTGTESGSGSASYTIVAAPTPTPTPKPTPGPVTVKTTTHPDPNKWYAIKAPVFSWTGDNNATDYSYSLDTLPSTEPDDLSEGNTLTHSFPEEKDGTYYFHIKAKNDVGWGPSVHYKINIDTSLPEPFTVTAIKDETNNIYKIYFATNDKPAGIGNYEVTLDGQSLGIKTSNFTVPLSSKEIKVTATDLAGNKVESTLNLSTESKIETPTATPTETLTVNNNDTSPMSLWLIVIAVIASFIAIYAIVMTGLYFKENGHFKKLTQRREIEIPEKKNTKTTKKVAGTSDGIEESPIK